MYRNLLAQCTVRTFNCISSYYFFWKVTMSSVSLHQFKYKIWVVTAREKLISWILGGVQNTRFCLCTGIMIFSDCFVLLRYSLSFSIIFSWGFHCPLVLVCLPDVFIVLLYSSHHRIQIHFPLNKVTRRAIANSNFMARL